MPNYQNGKIYKIINDENDLVYYGSTTVPLWQRMGKHRVEHKRYLEGKRTRNITSFDILKYKNAQIVLVEDCPWDRKEQLTARERFWIENNKCVNKVIPGRTQKEYREIYNKENKEIIKKKSKEHYEQNKDKIQVKHREWKKNNKEKNSEINKQWYENNKERLNERRGEKIVCECGCEIRRDSLSKHKKSKKHINLMKK